MKSNSVTGDDLMKHKEAFQEYMLAMLNSTVNISFDQVLIPNELTQNFTVNALRTFFNISMKNLKELYNKQIDPQYSNCTTRYNNNSLSIYLNFYNVSEYFAIDYVTIEFEGFDSPIKLTRELLSSNIKPLNERELTGSIPISEDRLSQLGNYRVNGIYYSIYHDYLNTENIFDWDWDSFVRDYSAGFWN